MQSTSPESSLTDITRRVKELRNLHWGMFICWSFSTFSGVEWTRGVKDLSFFRATDADTDQWARTAKEAGMGYILFLTKHHDGFCLWNTATTERKVTNAPLGRDVLAELRESCDAHGIKLALYFSEGEFEDHPDYHPGGHTPEMKKAQLKELLTQYGPIEYIWFDHAQTDGGLSHAETVAWCHACQPGTLIGFNHGEAAGEISLREGGRPGPMGDPRFAGYNAENEANSRFLLAEFTYPILPKHVGGAVWFYSLPEHDHLCIAAPKIYKDYLGAVKHGNIFSIDVGPDYNGRLRAIDVKTLQEVGEMIRQKAPLPPSPVSEGKRATASSELASHHNASRPFDGTSMSEWRAKEGVTSGWLAVDLEEDQTISEVRIAETANRIQSFAIEYRDGNDWKEIVRGTTIGPSYSASFAPIIAREVRLNIFQASDSPAIDEFELF